MLYHFTAPNNSAHALSGHRQTGEIKEKKKSIQYYPDKYKKRIGLSYSDYLQAREASKFEDFSDYSDQPMDNSLFNNTAGDDA